MELDQTDLRILEELTRNSRITMKQLGENVHLTGQAAATRVAKLEDNGILEGYTIKVNEARLGQSIHAFITIYTYSPQHKPYLTYVEAQAKHVANHYKVSGEGCYLLECRFPSHERLDRFLVALNEHANYKVTLVINKQ